MTLLERRGGGRRRVRRAAPRWAPASLPALAAAFAAQAADVGAAAELALGARWSVHAVWMNSRNEDPANGIDRSFNYYGAEVGYRADAALARMCHHPERDG